MSFERRATTGRRTNLTVNPMGKVPTVAAWRRAHHRGGGDLRPSRRMRFRERKLNVPVGDSAARGALSPQMGVLRPELRPSPAMNGFACFPRKDDPPRQRAASAMGDYRHGDRGAGGRRLRVGPYPLLGEQFTAADVVIGSGPAVRHDVSRGIPERPEFVAYVGRPGGTGRR